jgi:hypothetical protein
VELALALIGVLLPLVFPETKKVELVAEVGGEREESNSPGSSSAWGRRVSDFLLCDSVEDRIDRWFDKYEGRRRQSIVLVQNARLQHGLRSSSE